jgi:hypothetical protein
MSAPQGERSSPAAQAPPGSASIDMSGNLMHGPEGRTSRLTLISVLLGAMVGALIAVLPPNPTVFVTTVLSPDHLLIDLQVLAVLLTVFDVWIESTWNGILGISPFDFLNNFQLYLTAVTMFGWILSLSDFRAWVVWGAGVAAMGLFNVLSFQIVRRVPIPWWRLALFIGLTLAAAYVGSNLYGLLPGWVAPPIPPLLWVGVVIAVVVVNLVMFTVYLHAYAARFARLAQ